MGEKVSRKGACGDIIGPALGAALPEGAVVSTVGKGAGEAVSMVGFGIGNGAVALGAPFLDGAAVSIVGSAGDAVSIVGFGKVTGLVFGASFPNGAEGCRKGVEVGEMEGLTNVSRAVGCGVAVGTSLTDGAIVSTNDVGVGDGSAVGTRRLLGLVVFDGWRDGLSVVGANVSIFDGAGANGGVDGLPGILGGAGNGLGYMFEGALLSENIKITGHHIYLNLPVKTSCL